MPKPLDGIVVRHAGGEWYRMEVFTSDGRSLGGISALQVEWNGSEHRYEAHLTILDPQVDLALAPHQVRVTVTDIDGTPIAPPRSAEGLMTQGPGEAT